MESILKSYTPIMISGVHASWTSDNGVFYKFNLEWENGDKGSALSKETKPSWKIGTKFSYEVKDSPQGKSFSKLKPADAPPFGAKKPFTRNPWFPKENAAEWALETARKLENSKIDIEINGVPYRPTAGNMISVAKWVLSLINKGYDKNAIECAFTSAAALALNSKEAVAGAQIIEDIAAFDLFLKSK